MPDRLGELLVVAGVLDRPTLERARGEQQRRGGTLGGILVGMGMVGEDTYVRALSGQLQLAAVSLDPSKVPGDVARSVPRELCDRYGLVPFRLDDKRGVLDVAMIDATRNEAIDEVEARTGLKVRPFVAGPRAIDRVVEAHFSNGAPPAKPPRPAPKPASPPPPAAKPAGPPPPAPASDVQRIEDLEQAVRRLENLVLALVGLLVDEGKVDRAELGRRIAKPGGGK